VTAASEPEGAVVPGLRSASDEGRRDVEAPAGERANQYCSQCGALTGAGDAFCEVCGHELAPAVVSAAAPGFVPACPVCSLDPSLTGGVTPDGYCESCGRKVPTGRDHIELDLGLLAGVTDRGIRHPRNEDAMALATAETPAGPAAIAVVCDGVSSSPRPDEASLIAAEAAVRELLDAVRMGDDLSEASADAVQVAARALAAIGTVSEAPSTTYVSAVAGADGVTVCWMGDSRAYWLADSDPVQLSTDDSLAEEMIASGVLDAAAAMASPQAHVITRWLGADITDPEPHVITFTPPGPGVVLVCTDGLWNYRDSAEGLAAMALPAALSDPASAAAGLLKFALEAGGVDNITAVLIPYPLRSAG
jgi:serine/threonine protein phosphatase PrpC